METLLALACGALAAASVYLLLSRNALRIVLGLVVLSNAANLSLFLAGRLSAGIPPIIPPGALVPPEAAANPLPQALVLTAIVIGFALIAFVLVLLGGTYRRLGTVDTEAMRLAEPETAPKSGGKAGPDEPARQAVTA